MLHGHQTAAAALYCVSAAALLVRTTAGIAQHTVSSSDYIHIG